MRWHRILNEKGWAAPRQPVNLAAQAGVICSTIFASACARHKAPRLYPMGVGMIGRPVWHETAASALFAKLLSGEHIGARAIQSRARLIWPACNAKPSAMAMIIL